MPNENNCRDWSATHHSDKLKVEGHCTFPTPGYKVHFKKTVPQGINPLVLLLDKIVVAPTGIEPQHVVTIPVIFEEETTVAYTKIHIMPDGPSIEVHRSSTASK